MAFTVKAARATVLDHLDDEAGARFARVNGAADYTKVDRFLRVAVDMCLDAYGGEAFNETITATTSADDGTVGLAQEQIRRIRGVLYSPTDGVLSSVDAGDDLAGYKPDYAARALTLKIVRRFPIDDVPSEDDLLLGTIDGAARSWDAFDGWVCLNAAFLAGIKDKERREDLLLAEDRLAKSIKGKPTIPQALPWGGRQQRRTSLAQQLSWLWTGRTQTLALVMGGGY